MTPSEANITTLSTVYPERVEFLWHPWLPVGKLVVLDGDPSVGKSTVSVDLIARLTAGALWPDGTRAPIIDVLLASAEDGLGDTVRPRLDAAGADVARVHAITSVPSTGEDGKTRNRPLTLADTDAIEAAIRKFTAKLLVVDVLMAYLPSKVDAHRDSDVRGVLSELAAVADRTSCTVLLLRHLNKSGGSNPLYRGGGSIGIVGAARAAMIAAVDPDDESRRILASTKSNLTAMPGALAYRLVDSPDHGCARVEWLGASDHRAGDLLDTATNTDRTERDDAVDWLVGYVQDNGGAVSAADAIRDAGRDGIAKTTLTRARNRAGIVTTKGGLRGGWLWQIPTPRIHEGTEEPRSYVLDSSDSSGDSSATPTEIGPCARCGTRTRKYGDQGSPLCLACRIDSDAS